MRKLLLFVLMLFAAQAWCACTPTTATLPGGSVGVAYNTMGPLTFTGCTGTLTLSLSSGSFPPGSPAFSFHQALGLWTIQGTPTAAGVSNFVIHACDSLGSCGDGPPLSITIGFLPPVITTYGLPAGRLAVAYSATLAATSGAPPLTWSITGSLPSGLTLNSATGVISGTPSSSGRFLFTVKVQDNQSPPLSATWTTAQIYIAASSTEMWSLPTTATGWQWAAPTGTTYSNLCKGAAISTVDTSSFTHSGQFPTMIPDKYPNLAAWASAQSDRMRSWGFNAADQYSFDYAHNAPAGGVPALSVFQVNGHLMRDDYPYHLKELYSLSNVRGQVCGSRQFAPSSGGMPDMFEPNSPLYYMQATAQIDTQCGSGHRCITTQAPMVITEEGDYLFGFNQYLTGANHVDFAVMIMDSNPAMNSSNGGYAYPDKAVYAKFAMRDYVANIYGCSGSADPAAANYCGSTPAATSLTALNAAWGTHFSTWNTSCSGGIASIHSGTYSCYGTGTGFLDESGTHVLNSSAQSTCRLYPDQNWGTTAQVETDGHNFVAYAATVYAQLQSAAWSLSVLAPHPPIVDPIYDGPTYVYQALAPYFDGIYISPNTAEGSQANRTATVERIIGAIGDRPIVYEDYSSSNCDSFWGCGASGGYPHYPLQNNKGVGLVSDWQSILPLKNASNHFPIVWIGHWPFGDQLSEGWDGGFVDIYTDDPYDGSAAVFSVNHSNTWAALPSTVTAPTLIWDGANYEALSGGITGSCTKGAIAPTWATKMGASTVDNTCFWRNEGPYTLKSEITSNIPSTATIPGIAFGDTITPIANFLNAGICDKVGPSVVYSVQFSGNVSTSGNVITH